MKKRILSVIMAISMLMSFLPVIANAASSGECGAYGNNLTWTLDDNGTLTISGIGEMKKMSVYESVWDRDSIKKVVINNGATNVGEYAFAGCSNLTKVIIPSSIQSIDWSAFGCPRLPDVYYDGTEEQWKNISKGFAGGDFSGLENAKIHYNYDSANKPDISEPSNNSVKSEIKNINLSEPMLFVNDRTLIPMRSIFEALGASVEWNQQTQTITSKKDDTTINLKINDTTINVNGKAVTLDAPAKIANDRTFVPVRAISEAFGGTVAWDGNAKKVTVTAPDYILAINISYEDISNEVNQINAYMNQGSFAEAVQLCESTKANRCMSDNDTKIIDDLYSRANTILTVGYADILANVNQINYFIKNGMYLEAIRECEQTKEWNILSPADITLLDDLKNTAQARYDAYIDETTNNSPYQKLKTTIIEKGTYDNQFNNYVAFYNAVEDSSCMFTYSPSKNTINLFYKYQDMTFNIFVYEDKNPDAILSKNVIREYDIIGDFENYKFHRKGGSMPSALEESAMKLIDPTLELIDITLRRYGYPVSLADLHIAYDKK